MALIGSIIGDIIGSQYEFPSWRPDDLDYENCELFTDNCEFTDDTVMSIATKYAIDHYKCDFAKAYKEFGKMYPDVGYGDMFFKWINDEIDNYESYGNGSAMRVSYIADVVQDADNVLKLAEHSAKCTHGSESGIMGACVTAAVIAMAKLQYSKEEIKEWVVEHTSYDISLPIEILKHKYVWNETCNGTVPAAIRCFLDSTDYESCIRNCLSLPCDMDTMCCIAGGMAEAVDCCDEWLCFQNFAEWYDSHYYETDGQAMEVDKDWIKFGNKIYCPEFCEIVPSIINSCLLNHEKIKNFELPTGITYDNSKYKVRLSIEGKRKDLGSYSDLKRAMSVYKNAKINYVKDLAKKYKDYIPKVIYDNMMDIENRFDKEFPEYAEI